MIKRSGTQIAERSERIRGGSVADTEQRGCIPAGGRTEGNWSPVSIRAGAQSESQPERKDRDRPPPTSHDGVRLGPRAGELPL